MNAPLLSCQDDSTGLWTLDAPVHVHLTKRMLKASNSFHNQSGQREENNMRTTSYPPGDSAQSVDDEADLAKVILHPKIY